MPKTKNNRMIDMFASFTKINCNILQRYVLAQEISDTRKIFQVSPKIMIFYNFCVTSIHYLLLKTLALEVDLISI